MDARGASLSDRFRPPGASRLAAWIAAELDGRRSVLGTPGELVFRPRPDHRFTLELRGRRLETPVGVAAGPHSQLATGLVAAWLSGARVIELKTVQTIDEIAVGKPCIDMADEGYNTEWSQELRVEASFAEYLTAWVLIHTLHARLGFPGPRPGVVFDVSVGYDLEGLRRPNMRWYLEHIANAGDELERCRSEVGRHLPEALEVEIPARLADSATLSTLHGCPPEEIGAIVDHLTGHWGLHTAVKLNPTLLGLDEVRAILADLGWRHLEPEPAAFSTDLPYPEALDLLLGLRADGVRRGLEVGAKLCNTLPVANRRAALPASEATAYLSGRPLHAVAVALAHRLTEDSGGQIPISFAGGADAATTPELLAAGLRPVTLCSDLLRPGGTLRLGHVLAAVDGALDGAGASSLDHLALLRDGRGDGDPAAAARRNLARYAAAVRSEPTLRADAYRRDRTKTARVLGPFDCIRAPCTDACAIDQRVPEYMRRVAAGDVDGAAAVIAADNPLPSILGRACHHPCEPVCLRTHLDEPLAIREIKRFVTEHGASPAPETPPDTGLRVAVVGAGPCGLAAATFLRRAGAAVTVFEAGREAGGMVSATIPGYRADPGAVRRDLDAASALGIEVVTEVVVGRDRGIGDLLARDFDHVVVAAGAQRGLRLGLENEEAPGVLDGLDFLRAVRRGSPPPVGRRVAVIGGGDVAVDCARSARRLAAETVELAYRRTRTEMPAHPEELAELDREGIAIRELLAPRRLVVEGGRLRAVEWTRTVLGEPDGSGRLRPEPSPGPGVTLELDTLIVAIGQRPDPSVLDGVAVELNPDGFVIVDPATRATSHDRVWAGGDLVAPGPSSIVEACGDGRRIAEAILVLEGLLDTRWEPPPPPEELDLAGLLRRRSGRVPRVETPRITRSTTRGFVEVVGTLSPDAARREAARCLDCDWLCSTCEGVCPNRAIVTYRSSPWQATGSADGDFQVGQNHQVAVLADLCNGCGNCATFCPTAGRPWRDKPRVYWHRGDFEAESDNAFMLLVSEGETLIQARDGGELHQLRDGDVVRYHGPGGAARLDRGTLEITAGIEPPLALCGAMLTLLRGITSSMPHLPAVEAEPGWVVGRER